MEIFPWRFILRDFFIEVLEIFIEDLFFGDFSFGIWFWRFFLWKMENFPFENGYIFFFMIKKWRRWRWTRNDEDLLMMIFFFFFLKNLSFEWTTLAGSWCGLLDKSLLNSCKQIISISNGFIHWNELEVLTQCPSLQHIPCLDWSWIHLILWPLGNMKEDHGPPSLVLAKRLSFSSLLETKYHENLQTI